MGAGLLERGQEWGWFFNFSFLILNLAEGGGQGGEAAGDGGFVNVVAHGGAKAGDEGGVFAGFEAEGAVVFFLEAGAEGFEAGRGGVTGVFDEDAAAAVFDLQVAQVGFEEGALDAGGVAAEGGDDGVNPRRVNLAAGIKGEPGQFLGEVFLLAVEGHGEIKK